MKVGNNLLKILVLFMVMTACREEDSVSPGSNLNDPSPEPTELDQWIYENFTEPYNIEVVYRWEESLVNQNRFLYPPLADSVRPALEIVKKLWINPYNEVAGTTFIKGLAPRQFVLVGGQNVNPAGTITLGLAEAGSRVTLFNIDLLRKNRRRLINRFIQTIQHEYTHILNQTQPFDEGQYGKISPEGYTAQWFNENDVDSRRVGFITAYARVSETEDFAEMVSEMLTKSKSEWDIFVSPKAVGAEGSEKIASKERIVVDYYKNKFGIDLYQLQDSTYRAILRLVN